MSTDQHGRFAVSAWPRRHQRPLPAAAATAALMAAALLAGCGSGSHPAAGTSPQPHTANAPASRDAADVKVIREWAAALDRGQIHKAASYFARPSVFANGFGTAGLIQALDVDSEHDAEVVNESLSCGAVLVSTLRRGKYIYATFRLTDRTGPGADCGTGTGQPAATDFVIRNGLIVDWIRAPVASGVQTLTTPLTPTNVQTPGAQV